jgi:hypothetical protein
LDKYVGDIVNTVSITIESVPENKLQSIKSFLQTLDLDFKLSDDNEYQYSEEFVEGILKAKDDLDKGKGTVYTLDELRKYAD